MIRLGNSLFSEEPYGLPWREGGQRESALILSLLGFYLIRSQSNEDAQSQIGSNFVLEIGVSKSICSGWP
jgi:hypothetical protein